MKKKIRKFEVGVAYPSGDIWVYVAREIDGDDFKWRWYCLFDHNSDKDRRKRFMNRAMNAQFALLERCE